MPSPHVGRSQRISGTNSIAATNFGWLTGEDSNTKLAAVTRNSPKWMQAVMRRQAVAMCSASTCTSFCSWWPVMQCA